MGDLSDGYYNNITRTYNKRKKKVPGGRGGARVKCARFPLYSRVCRCDGKARGRLRNLYLRDDGSSNPNLTKKKKKKNLN